MELKVPAIIAEYTSHLMSCCPASCVVDFSSSFVCFDLILAVLELLIASVSPYHLEYLLFLEYKGPSSPFIALAEKKVIV